MERGGGRRFAWRIGGFRLRPRMGKPMRPKCFEDPEVKRLTDPDAVAA